jgi:hypothetical protein
MYLIKAFVRNNKILVLLILLYSLTMFSVISWGIPSENRPFTYNMDEWHQLEAVRALFTRGTPNVPGAAHGSIFQFFLSGIYLIPFVIFGIINPFTIHSSIDNFAMQERLFMVLRSNTLLFGILSIITLAIIVKKYLKTNSILTTLLVIGTPIWLVLSSNYKYDVALIFWIILAVLFIINYAKFPTARNFIFSAIPCALAFATKVSAVPIFVIYILSYFWFTPHWQKKYKRLILGLIVFLTVFILFGIPDLIFRWSDYMEYFYSNLVSVVKIDSSYLLGFPNKWMYILLVLLPINFGHIFYILFFTAFIYWFIQITKWFYSNKYADHRIEIFLFFSLVLFLLSLIPLGLGATGNRLLVLLPFFCLLSAKFLTNVFGSINRRIYLVIIISVLVLAQFYESSVVIYSKYNKNILQQSSEWIIKNISKGRTIGIENIPIYQTLPDVALKEYYLSLLNKKANNNYKYEVIDFLSIKLPDIVIISDRYMSEKYLIKSPKKELLIRLKKENYRVIKDFLPDRRLYWLFYDDLSYHLSGLNFIFPITIYERS